MAARPSIGEFSMAKHPYLCLPKTCHLQPHGWLLQSTWGLGPKNWRLPNTARLDPGDMDLAYPDILDSVKRGRGSPPSSSRNVEPF